MEFILGLVFVVGLVWGYDYHKNYGFKHLKHNKDQGKVVL